MPGLRTSLHLKTLNQEILIFSITAFQALQSEISDPLVNYHAGLRSRCISSFWIRKF